MFPDPLFKIFSLEIDLYTICFAVGVIACLVFTILAMKKSGYSSTARDTIIVIGILAIIVGLVFAVLFQNLYDYIEYQKGPKTTPFEFSGRMTFIGGLIGGVITFVGVYFLYVYVINPKLKEGSFFKSDMNKGIWYLLRIAPISITIAHAFGRIGCFCAGCCGGKETNAWFGVQFPGETVKVIPTQLFEAIFLFLLSAVMIVLLFVVHFKYNMTVYLVSYGIWRFIIEFFRNDDRGGFIPGLTPSQFWSIVMVLGGVAVFFIYWYFDKKIEQKESEEKSIQEQ